MVEKEINALVLAGPERKRILRDLLNRSDHWTAADRVLYRQIIRAEWRESMRLDDKVPDELTASAEKQIFIDLVCKGAAPDHALNQAAEIAKEVVREVVKRPSKGQKERDRRRTYREAVTAGRGALAVTTGLVENCIVCGKVLYGGPHWRGGKRGDTAYCGNACKQKAYRERRKMNRASK